MFVSGVHVCVKVRVNESQGERGGREIERKTGGSERFRRYYSPKDRSMCGVQCVV
jgi:hypothetical protein